MVKYLLPPVKKGSFSGPFFHNVVLSEGSSELTDLAPLRLAEVSTCWTEVAGALGEVPSGLTVVVVTAGVTVVATALAKLPTSLTEVPMISILIPLLVNILVVGSNFKLKF